MREREGEAGQANVAAKAKANKMREGSKWNNK